MSFPVRSACVSKIFACSLGFLGAIILSAQTCPTCFSPSLFSPYPGGEGTSSDGRRILNVCFDSSTQVNNSGGSTPGTTNPGLYNALISGYTDSKGLYHAGAISQWNNATDGNGNKDAYYLQYVTNCSQAAVTISYLPTSEVGGGCAQVVSTLTNNVETSAKVSVSTMMLQQYSTNPGDVVTGLAHEFGHIFGLDDSTSCGATVMGGHYDGSCQFQYTIPINVNQNPVLAQDVKAANAVISRSTACNQAFQTTAGAPGTGEGNGGAQCDGQPPICSDYAICVGGNWECYSTPTCDGIPEPTCDSGYTAVCTPGGGWECQESPVILDPFDEGFHLTDVAAGVKFKALSNDPLRQMSWTDAVWRNALLALDRNGNGKIDDMTELFGDLTPQPKSDHPNGYLALAVFDDPANGGNGDGWIDPEDSIYSHLLLWIDANHNGISEPEELHSLADLGIFRISLNYHFSSYTDANGNVFRYRSEAIGDTGAHACYDVFLLVSMSSQ
jgi:hypothetical protein